MNKKIPALLPKNHSGHQFVVYADSCSGLPGREHARNLQMINAVLQRLAPPPEFVCFPGDEIAGLTNDAAELRRQWDYWLHREMAWLQECGIPLYNTTGNHTTYNLLSENVFRQVFPNLPQNGPAGQKGLSYYVKQDDLLLIFVNTLWSGLGGEGRMETAWLEQVLAENPGISKKLVFGHHPVFPVNGFAGERQRTIESNNGSRFWSILRKYGVTAYICSHLLAFDVQVQEGVLQITTAGAGTASRMPAEYEYLHAFQMAIDDEGLHYQVLDTEGKRREWLHWPLVLTDSTNWQDIEEDTDKIHLDNAELENSQTVLVFEFSGRLNPDRPAAPQTLIGGWTLERELPEIWLGLTGSEQRVTVYISPGRGKSPHHWYGPELANTPDFNIQICIHNGMGPGGLLWRRDPAQPWCSLQAASPWGAERMQPPKFWSTGTGRLSRENNLPFAGEGLRVKFAIEKIRF